MATPRKSNAGRKSKLTPQYLEIAEKILNEDINAIIFTDEELHFQINENLPIQSRISDTTWESWKRGDLKDPMGIEFLRLYKRALQMQKANLFKHLRTEPAQWQKYAWIIERKFSDWNLRNINETDITTKGKALDNTIKVVFTDGAQS